MKLHLYSHNKNIAISFLGKILSISIPIVVIFYLFSKTISNNLIQMNNLWVIY